MKEFEMYDEEIYEKVNRGNKALLKDFILEYKSRGRKPSTIEQYAFDIRMFFCWNYVNNEDACILDKKACNRKLFRRFFIDFQEYREVGNARINRVQCALRNLLEYASEDDDCLEEWKCEINQMKKIKGLVKEEKREIIFLSEEQIQLVLAELIKREEYQKALLMSLAYESGGRRNELFQVTKSSMMDHSANCTNQVIGKRGKKFKLRYYKQTIEIFDLYLAQRGDDDCDALFYQKDKKGKVVPVGYSTLYKWTVDCRAILKELTGEYLMWNCHSYRHSCAENLKRGTHHILAELGKDSMTIDEIKYLLHHKDATTTEGYLKNMDEEMEDDLFGVEY